MITYYVIRNGFLCAVSQKEVDSGIEPHWIDVFHPTNEEKELLNGFLKINVSMEIDQLSRHKYEKKGGIYATAHAMCEDKKMRAMNMILTTDTVVTERYSTFYGLEQRLDALKNDKIQAKNQNDIFLNLTELLLNHIEDNLEEVCITLDAINHTLFHAASGSVTHQNDMDIDFDRYMNDIGRNGDFIAINQRSLLSMDRALRFLIDSRPFDFSKEEITRSNKLINDLTAVEDHASVASDRIGFVLNVCLGMIGIKQNTISKIMSIVALTFLPPATIAGLYGMNFHEMPELNWEYGYPYALILMFLFASLPVIYCKIKNWF